MRARIVEERTAFVLQQEDSRQEQLIQAAHKAFETEKADMATQGYNWNNTAQKFWHNEQGYAERKEQAKIEVFKMPTYSNDSNVTDTAVYTVYGDKEKIGIDLFQSMNSDWTACFIGFAYPSLKQKQAEQAETNEPEKSLFMESGMLLKTINQESVQSKPYQEVLSTIRTALRPLTLEFGYMGNDITKLDDEEIQAFAQQQLEKSSNHAPLYTFLNKVYKDVPRTVITDDFTTQDIEGKGTWEAATCSYDSSVHVFVVGGQFVDHHVDDAKNLAISVKSSGNTNWPVCFNKYTGGEQGRLKPGMVLISINGYVASGSHGRDFDFIKQIIDELPEGSSATLCFATTDATIIENATVVVNPPHKHMVNPLGNKPNRLDIYGQSGIRIYKLSAPNTAVQDKWATVMETRTQQTERNRAIEGYDNTPHRIQVLTASIQDRIEQQTQRVAKEQYRQDLVKEQQQWEEGREKRKQEERRVRISGLVVDEKYALFKRYAEKEHDVPGYGYQDDSFLMSDADIQKLERMFILLNSKSNIRIDTGTISNPEYGILNMIKRIRTNNAELKTLREQQHNHTRFVGTQTFSETQRIDKNIERCRDSNAILQADIELNTGFFTPDQLDRNLAYLKEYPQNRLKDMPPRWRPLNTGDHIEANYRGRGMYYPAVISDVNLDAMTYDIEYQDGRKGKSVPVSRILRKS
jgi:hypothetical protein